MAIALTVIAFAMAPWGGGEAAEPDRAGPPLTLSWKDNYLLVEGAAIPGGRIEVLYLEAYCRSGAHEADWVEHTVVGHRTELVSRNEAGTEIELACTVDDGLAVRHRITAGRDEVTFEIDARNPTDRTSEAEWAQPCVRVGEFTGTGAADTDDAYAYIKKSFVFLDGQLERMPTRDWATEARYVPGQVWAAPGVAAGDVNPRPLNPNTPSNGLIGCFSGDDRMILALAFEPYHELFQGVIRCLHSDFRLGRIGPGESRRIKGKMYLVPNDVPALLERYRRDFPESGAGEQGPSRD